MYAKCYEELNDWVDGSLDAYKPELRAVLFPLFVHSYLQLVQAGERDVAAAFLEELGAAHTLCHRSEINLLAQITSPAQVDKSPFAARLLSRRFDVPMSSFGRALLLQCLQDRRLSPLLSTLNTRINITCERLHPAADGADAETVAAATAAAAASQLWKDVDADTLSALNAVEVAWGRLEPLETKHKAILLQLEPPTAAGEVSQPVHCEACVGAARLPPAPPPTAVPTPCHHPTSRLLRGGAPLTRPTPCHLLAARDGTQCLLAPWSSPP